MQYFRRSLRYLWPYRFRLGVAVLCVLCIAALWGGGLGLMLPGAKILLSPEGLHGWAYNSMVEDRLGVTLVQQEVAIVVEGQAVTSALQVVSVNANGPGAAARLPAAAWIIGTGGPEGARLLPARDLARTLANAPAGETVRLRVYNAALGGQISEPLATLEDPKFASRALGAAARRIPEPADWAGRFDVFLVLLVVILVMTILRNLFTFLQEYLVGTAIWRGVMDLRCQNYNVVLHLPTTFFSEKGVTDSMSRFIADTNELAKGQNTLLGKTLVEPAKAIGSLAVALTLSWQLTLIGALAGPPAFYVIKRLGKSMHKASRRALESWSSMLAVLEETLTGIRVVKAYTMEGAERRRFFRVNRKLVKQLNKMERLDAATGPAVETLGLIAGLAAAGAAGFVVFKGAKVFGQHYQMDPYTFISWLGVLFAIFDPVRKLAKVSTKFQQSDAAAKRVFELQDSQQEKTHPGAASLPRHRESLEFRNISYRYPNAATDAVQNVNLTVRAGQTVAIVGPNGCGKTTLVSLLPRLMDPTGGQILLDGLDIADHSIRSLRRQIGLVTQDAVLFHATIGENIAYGLRRPHREDVLAAAKQAFVDEFVSALPEGYDTIVGEKGSTLSGGQKQRISIARAILRNPAILIFDEALSQIDPESEHRISQAMTQFIKGRTTLMIAHRFQTILSADMIVVMNAGQIVDSGKHEDLLSRCDLYKTLYQTQFVNRNP